MDTNTQPDAIELIRLADLTQSISVRLRSTEPTLETPAVRHYDAEVVVASGFVNGTVYLGFDSEDPWGQLLDAIEEAEQEADLDEPYARTTALSPVASTTHRVILMVAMPVAAAATMWTAKGEGDQPTMVGLVLASTLLSPLTTPLLLAALAPLLSGGYAQTLTSTSGSANSGFTLATVVLPCAAGLLCALVLPLSCRDRLLMAIVPSAIAGSLVLTYVNASGALGSFLARPRPLLFAAALAMAALVCLLSFVLGRTAARILRLDAPVASSLTLACGMNNSSASAVLITTLLPDKPHLLLPVLAYGLLQKTAASRVVTGLRHSSASAAAS
ncbi:DUF5959 family protein [Streptomyces sp. NPDC056653]|uniref:DUF5959 family protein n=1 Tax=Streptomyces sp. NPDC056653 TaxID=3345894 RepID=UPI00369AA229